MSKRKDICINCGTQHNTKLWDAECYCDDPKVIKKIIEKKK
jgi:hypothetical protein